MPPEVRRAQLAYIDADWQLADEFNDKNISWIFHQMRVEGQRFESVTYPDGTRYPERIGSHTLLAKISRPRAVLHGGDERRQRGRDLRGEHDARQRDQPRAGRARAVGDPGRSDAGRLRRPLGGLAGAAPLLLLPPGAGGRAWGRRPRPRTGGPAPSTGTSPPPPGTWCRRSPRPTPRRGRGSLCAAPWRPRTTPRSRWSAATAGAPASSPTPTAPRSTGTTGSESTCRTSTRSARVTAPTCSSSARAGGILVETCATRASTRAGLHPRAAPDPRGAELDGPASLGRDVDVRGADHRRADGRVELPATFGPPPQP